MLSEEIISRVQAETNLLALVKTYIPLQEGRKAYKGNCPFHDDNQSFMVMADKNIFKCFGCGREGGPVEFLALISNKSMHDAVTILAQQIDMQGKQSA